MHTYLIFKFTPPKIVGCLKNIIRHALIIYIINNMIHCAHQDSAYKYQI